MLFRSALEEAGFDPNLVQLAAEAPGEGLAKTLALDPAVRIIDFTGSTEFGDFVVMGGQSGTVGHIKIGTGAQVAGASHPKDDVPAGARVGGTPARPLKDWARELAVLSRLGKKGVVPQGTETDENGR